MKIKFHFIFHLILVVCVTGVQLGCGVTDDSLSIITKKPRRRGRQKNLLKDTPNLSKRSNGGLKKGLKKRGGDKKNLPESTQSVKRPLISKPDNPSTHHSSKDLGHPPVTSHHHQSTTETQDRNLSVLTGEPGGIPDPPVTLEEPDPISNISPQEETQEQTNTSPNSHHRKKTSTLVQAPDQEESTNKPIHSTSQVVNDPSTTGGDKRSRSKNKSKRKKSTTKVSKPRRHRRRHKSSQKGGTNVSAKPKVVRLSTDDKRPRKGKSRKVTTTKGYSRKPGRKRRRRRHKRGGPRKPNHRSRGKVKNTQKPVEQGFPETDSKIPLFTPTTANNLHHPKIQKTDTLQLPNMKKRSSVQGLTISLSAPELPQKKQGNKGNQSYLYSPLGEDEERSKKRFERIKKRAHHSNARKDPTQKSSKKRGLMGFLSTPISFISMKTKDTTEDNSSEITYPLQKKRRGSRAIRDLPPSTPLEDLENGTPIGFDHLGLDEDSSEEMVEPTPSLTLKDRMTDTIKNIRVKKKNNKRRSHSEEESEEDPFEFKSETNPRELPEDFQLL